MSEKIYKYFNICLMHVPVILIYISRGSKYRLENKYQCTRVVFYVMYCKIDNNFDGQCVPKS